MKDTGLRFYVYGDCSDTANDIGREPDTKPSDNISIKLTTGRCESSVTVQSEDGLPISVEQLIECLNAAISVIRGNVK